MRAARGIRSHHIAFGYAGLAVALGVLAVPLSGGLGLLIVTVPMLGVALVMLLAGLVGEAAPRAGAALTVGLLLSIAGWFTLVELAYDPDGSHRESTLRTVGSALENNAFAHAPAAIAAVHLAFAIAAALLLTGTRPHPHA